VPIELAGPAHGGRVEDRHHFLEVIHHDAIEQALVSILKRDQVDVFLDVRRLVAKILQDLLHLLFLREDPGRQEPSQLQRVPFFL
jgi:hypothetical protein